MKVITYNGREELREDCVFIRGKYYHKERDCFFHNGIYYSPFSRYLVTDHETNKKVHTAVSTVSFGVVGRDKDGFKFGHFSPNIARNGDILLPIKLIKDEDIAKVIEDKSAGILEILPVNGEVSSGSSRLSGAVRDPLGDNSFGDPLGDELRHSLSLEKFKRSQRLMKCMNVWPFIEAGYVSSDSSDTIAKNEDVKFYNKELSTIGFATKTARNPYGFNLAYNSEVMMEVFQRAYDNIKIDPANLAPYGTLAGYIGDKTFGIEYESWDGRIPTYLAASAGLIPLRDGSLRHDNICGYEYASVVMSGAKGLETIKSQCDLLRDFTVFNERCSVHIHIGNIQRTKENLIHLYNGLRAIQDSLYSMYPSCLQKTSTFKQKDYCSPLPALVGKGVDLTEHAVVHYLSDGTDKFSKFGKPHPKDMSAQHKWNINSRF